MQGISCETYIHMHLLCAHILHFTPDQLILHELSNYSLVYGVSYLEYANAHFYGRKSGHNKKDECKIELSNLG